MVEEFKEKIKKKIGIVENDNVVENSISNEISELLDKIKNTRINNALTAVSKQNYWIYRRK